MPPPGANWSCSGRRRHGGTLFVTRSVSPRHLLLARREGDVSTEHPSPPWNLNPDHLHSLIESASPEDREKILAQLQIEQQLRDRERFKREKRYLGWQYAATLSTVIAVILS